MTCKANYATRVNRIMPAGLIGFHTNWSDSGRIHFEAAFAALAGICPLSASSGNTSWRRLNRGGVRRLNRAIHTIVRMNFYSRTKAYVAKRTAEGHSKKETIRNLSIVDCRFVMRFG